MSVAVALSDLGGIGGDPASAPERAAVPPPNLALYLTEVPRTVAEFGQLVALLPLQRALPAGDGHPVLVLPGLMVGDGSTWTLRRLLRRLGYRAHGWRLGLNIGPTA